MSQKYKYSYLPKIKNNRDCCSSIQQSIQRKSTKKQKQRQKTRFKTQQIKSEKQLMFQLKNLQEVLNKKMTFINNFLFSTQKGSKLIQNLTQELTRNCSSFDYECFGKIFQEELEETDIKPSSIYKKIRSLGKQNQISYHQNQKSKIIDLETIEEKSTNISVNDTIKSRGHIFNNNDLQKFIKKQDKIITIWVPPASYPQFYAFLVYGKTKQLQSNLNLIKIQKIFIPNYLKPMKMFHSLFIFLEKILEMKIDYIEYITSKVNYYEKFKKWDWILKGINNNQYRVWLPNQNYRQITS